MTGLNLESFLHLLRADVGAWATLGVIVALLALMAWTSWGSRRALRKCLVLSVLAHFGLALYGGTVPFVVLAIHPDEHDEHHDRIRQIKVLPSAGDEGPGAGDAPTGPGGGPARWDQALGGLALVDAKLTGPRSAPSPEVVVRPGARTELKTASATPEATPPDLSAPESRPDVPEATDGATPPPPPGGEDDVDPAVVAPRPGPDAAPAGGALPDNRLRPERPRPVPESGPSVPRRPSTLTTILPETPAPAASPAAVATAPELPSEPIENRSTPTVPAEPGPGDVADVTVAAVGPGATRTNTGETDLRARSRPETATEVPTAPAPRPPLAVVPLQAPTIDATADTPITLADRPVEAEGNGRPTVEARPAAPGVGDVTTAEVVKAPVSPLPRAVQPESDVRRRSRPAAGAASTTATLARRPAAPPIALARVTPGGVPALPEIRGATGNRPLADVPEVYRSRLDPNRSARAFRSGASPASEQAVERALDWLARHQDLDGRWDGATAKYDEGTAVKGDDDYTVHCPAGETCFGECSYWEADTALTGLALLSYLGAGYTQADGKYAETVSRGLDFLLASQKPDGDLRGPSRAVGMYCHAMATIALCEAYAMTGDDRLRAPTERAVAFLVRSRARDGLAWRYAPGAPVGDTSILGWVVMALKSAREVGIAVPGDAQARAGSLTWLTKVSTGGQHGLARYQPWDTVTPTMTAEAWVCRQFLGSGGPGAASTEAAAYLLEHGPKAGPYNLYYWYYGTLAMYQHGGDAWYRWNAEVRDELTTRQIVSGHSAGSWAPDDSPYGAKGGRIYCTALATLSLEVYYRYLRLYDDPKIPPAVAPRPRVGDPALGRRDTPAGPSRGTATRGPNR